MKTYARFFRAGANYVILFIILILFFLAEVQTFTLTRTPKDTCLLLFSLLLLSFSLTLLSSYRLEWWHRILGSQNGT